MLAAKLSIALVLLALVSVSAGFIAVTGDVSTFCATGLGVTVVGAAELNVVGVGLLLIKLSTRADVTLVCIVVENVLASGGTIGMNGIG